MPVHVGSPRLSGYCVRPGGGSSFTPPPPVVTVQLDFTKRANSMYVPLVQA